MLVNEVEPKVAVPEKSPTTITFPAVSNVTPLALSCELPPARTVHSTAPVEERLQTNTSNEPREVKLVEPNVAVPVKKPTV